jgi:hypothetical protein
MKKLIFAVIVMTLVGCVGMSNEHRYVIDGGDGDQSYFQQPITIRKVEEDWFTGRIRKFEKAKLFLIEGGPHAGEYLAISPSWNKDVEDSISDQGFTLGIVFHVTNPTPSFNCDDPRDAQNVGRGYIVGA